jgi:ferritin-like metal-binding protein YciE
VLPKLHRAVQSEGLAGAVAKHLEQTREHGPRLETVFRAVGAEPSSNLNPPLEKLAQHHDELAESVADDRLADVFHAAASAATEHHELAGYDALLALAQAIELPADARSLLERNRAEEAEALSRLEGELERLAGDLRQ